ncbi:MAG TPA: WD40 repeat domain-containing protein [Solirubrobacteraceae bacterium]
MTSLAPTASELLVPTTPYKGLVPYTEEDAPFFFGRDEWREIIIDNLRAYRLTLLYGDSGVGKSSVLHAGVLHELRRRARQAADDAASPGLAVTVFRSWRDDPVGALVRALYESVADVTGQPATPAPAAPADLSAAIETCAMRAGGKLFIVLDQFEEYFLYHPRDEQGDTFPDAFADAVNRRNLRVSFLISIREDALAKLDRFKGRLPSLFDNYLRIDHLDRGEARAAIEMPLDEYSRRVSKRFTIEPLLVESVLDDVETGKVVVGRAGAGTIDVSRAADHPRIETPYLQLVLTRLWNEEMAMRSRCLRLETFQALGGAQGIVRTHLDAAMSALPAAAQDIAAELFNHLVTPSGTKIAQSVSDLADYAELPEAVAKPILETLSGEVRILRPVGEASYEIYHDALAAPILDWRERREAEQQRRKERRRIRLFGIVALVSVIVAAAVTVLGLVALDAKNTSDAARRREARVNKARSNELADTALRRSRVAPDQAAKLALRAMQMAPTERAAGALRAAAFQPSLSAVLPAHGHPVPAAVFSPDGRIVAATSGDGMTRVWRVADGASVATLQGHSRAKLDGYDLPMDAAFRPGGKRVVTVGGDGRTRVWDTSSWRLVKTLRGHRGTAYSAEFSRDGKRLLTSGQDGTTRVWDASSWQPLAVLGHGRRAIRSAAFSPDGKLAVAAEPDSRLRVWDVASKRQIVVLGTPTRPLSRNLFVPHVSVAFSPNGRSVLAVTPDGRARLWDLARRRLVKIMRDGGGGAINSAAFSRDGTRFVTAGDDTTAKVYETKGGKHRATLKHGSQVSTAQFSPDGVWIVTGGATGTARIWDASKPSRAVAIVGRPETGSEGFILTAAFSPDGKRLVTSGDGGARLWDTGRQQPVAVLPARANTAGTTDVSPDGQLLVTSGRDGIVRVWRMADGRSVEALRGPKPAAVVKHSRPATRNRRFPRHGIFAAGFSANGKRFLTVGLDGASVWDTRTWRKLADLGETSPGAFSAAFSPDGTLVVTSHRDGTLRVWNATTGASVAALRAGSRTSPAIAAFSPDGTFVFAAGGFRPTAFWQVDSWRRVGFPGKQAGAVDVAAFSADGELVAGLGKDGRIRVWKTSSGERVAVLGRDDDVYGVRFSPDRRFVASTSFGASGDELTRVWELSSGTRVGVLKGYAADEPGDIFSPDAQVAVTVHDKQALVWQASTGQLVWQLPAGADRAIFSPTSRRIVTSSFDGPVRIYACTACGSTDEVVELARRRLSRAQSALRVKP